MEVTSIPSPMWLPSSNHIHKHIHLSVAPSGTTFPCTIYPLFALHESCDLNVKCPHTHNHVFEHLGVVEYFFKFCYICLCHETFV